MSDGGDGAGGGGEGGGGLAPKNKNPTQRCGEQQQQTKTNNKQQQTTTNNKQQHIVRETEGDGLRRGFEPRHPEGISHFQVIVPRRSPRS